MPNKEQFEIILHVGRVTSLQSWVAKKSCHGQTLVNECFIFDYPIQLVQDKLAKLSVSSMPRNSQHVKCFLIKAINMHVFLCYLETRNHSVSQGGYFPTKFPQQKLLI